MSELFSHFFSISIRAASALIAFIIQVLVANKVSQSGMGNYLIFLSWSRWADVVIGGRARQNSLRDSAELFYRDSRILDVDYISSKYHSILLYLVFPVLLGLSILIQQGYDFFQVMFFSIVYGVFMAVTRTISEIFKGTGKANLGLFFEFFLEQIIVITVLAVLTTVSYEISDTYVISIHLASIFLVFIVSYVTYIHLSKMIGSFRVIKDNNKTDIYFWGINIVTTTIWVLPYMLLPIYVDEVSIAEFGVSQRLVAVTTIVIVGLSAVYSRKYSNLISEKNYSDARKLLYKSQAFVLIVYFPFFVIYIFYPDVVLSLFGENYRSAKSILYIIAVGQFVNAATGLNVEFMHMMHNERIELFISLFVLVIGVILSFIMMSLYDVVGMAISFSVMLGMKNIISYVFCHVLLKKQLLIGA